MKLGALAPLLLSAALLPGGRPKSDHEYENGASGAQAGSCGVTVAASWMGTPVGPEAAAMATAGGPLQEAIGTVTTAGGERFPRLSATTSCTT